MSAYQYRKNDSLLIAVQRFYILIGHYNPSVRITAQLLRLLELLSIDIKEITLFIKISSLFSRVGYWYFKCAALRLSVASQQIAMSAQVSFWYQSYHSNLTLPYLTIKLCKLSNKNIFDNTDSSLSKLSILCFLFLCDTIISVALIKLNQILIKRQTHVACIL